MNLGSEIHSRACCFQKSGIVSNGVGLTVASQQSGSKTIEGVEISETYCGFYTNATKKFVSIIKATSSSPALIQGTEAVKQ